MAPASRRRWAASTAGAWLALAAAGWAFPSMARAGCAGHATPRGDAASAHYFELLSLAEGEPARESTPLPGDGPGPSCVGGMCMPPATPPVAPANPSPVRVDLWGCLGAEGPAPVGRASAWPRIDDDP